VAAPAELRPVEESGSEPLVCYAGNLDGYQNLGFLLESFAFIALALCFAALRTNAALVLVLLTLGVGYCLTGIPDIANAVGRDGWATVGYIGGAFLCASAFFAYYTGAAIAVNSAWKRPVLPLGGQP